MIVAEGGAWVADMTSFLVWLQWGRNLIVAEGGVGKTRRYRRGTGFNGAAT